MKNPAAPSSLGTGTKEVGRPVVQTKERRKGTRAYRGGSTATLLFSVSLGGKKDPLDSIGIERGKFSFSERKQ